MLADGKLPGIIAQHHSIAQEVVRVDAAPNCSFGCDQHRIWGCGQSGEAEPVEMRRPGGLIGEDCFRLLGQTGNQGADSARLRM